MTLSQRHFISIYFNSLRDFGNSLPPNFVQLNVCMIPDIGLLDTHVLPRPLLTIKGGSR
jgi:hypothetical protein